MKKLLLLVLCLVLAFNLIACGSTGAADTAVTQEAAAAESYDAGGENGLAMSRTQGQDSMPEDSPDKIIYSADVSVETKDFDGSIQALNQLIEQYEAWIESSSISGADYYSASQGQGSLSASYTIRVPSESFQELMGSLSQLGNIPYSHTYTENVSSQYYDAQARLDAYSAQEQRLLEMLSQAQSISDIIAIEDKLTELRYEIEALQTSLNNWDRQVDYSTVYIRIDQVGSYSPGTQGSFARQLLEALKSGSDGLIAFLGSLMLWLVSALPSLVLILIAFFVIRALVRRRRRRKSPPENK